MPKNKALPTSAPESIEEAWSSGDELAMTRAVVRKYARVLDMTDSGRDIKPLVTGMFEALDRVKMLEARDEETNQSQLFKIMQEAKSA